MSPETKKHLDRIGSFLDCPLQGANHRQALESLAAIREHLTGMHKIEEQLLGRYAATFPNYAWTDPETAIDLFAAEVTTLRTELAAIREHFRSAQNRAGDDLCWIVDPATAKALPEAEFLESCRRYRQQIADERGEVQGCKTIAQLEEQITESAFESLFGEDFCGRDFSTKLTMAQTQIAEMEQDHYRDICQMGGRIAEVAAERDRAVEALRRIQVLDGTPRIGITADGILKQAVMIASAALSAAPPPPPANPK